MMRGESVLQKEPGNQYDTQAIAFICNEEHDWERIGCGKRSIARHSPGREKCSL